MMLVKLRICIHSSKNFQKICRVNTQAVIIAFLLLQSEDPIKFAERLKTAHKSRFAWKNTCSPCLMITQTFAVVLT